MATRTLGPSSGGVGNAYLSAAASGRYNTGDTFSLQTDNYYFPRSPMQRVTITVPSASALAVSVPTGARAVVIQTPLGTTNNIKVSTSSTQMHWNIGPDGFLVSTLPSGTTTIYLHAETSDVADVTVAFL